MRLPQEMRAFWLPGKAPEAKVVLEKPDMGTTCPASGGKLKLKARPRWGLGAGLLLAAGAREAWGAVPASTGAAAGWG